VLIESDTSTISRGARIRCEEAYSGCDAIYHGYMALAERVIDCAQDNVSDWLTRHDRLKETLSLSEYEKKQLDVASSLAWLLGAESSRLAATYIYESMGAALEDVTEALTAKFKAANSAEFKAVRKIAVEQFEWKAKPNA